MGTTALVYAVLLGLSLAASTGLNTFLPLFLLAGAAHFNLLNAQNLLNGHFAWIASDGALAALAVATVFEVVADKIPTIDHVLDIFGTIARPVVGTFAAASVFTNTDPSMAALAGLIIGVPAALSFHAAKAGTRAASSATTLGIGNPILSTLEDLAALAMTLIALAFPLLAPFILIAAIVVIVAIFRVVRRRLPRKSVRGAVIT